MKQYKILLCVFMLGFFACGAKAPQPDNTKPMYGEVEKDERYKQVDDNFITADIKKFGSKDRAVAAELEDAWMLFSQNDLSTAMKRFNQAWLLNPEYPDTYYGFAALLQMQRNETEAERFYRMGLERDEEYERAYICLQRIAECKQQLGDSRGVADAYKRITDLWPHSNYWLNRSGYAQVQLGSWDTALEMYDRAMAMDSTDVLSYNGRAYVYQQKGNFTAAIADCTKAISLNPEYLYAYANRGLAEMEMESYQAAKKDFERCTQLKPESGRYRRMLGEAKLGLNDTLGARKDFELAKKLDDTVAEELTGVVEAQQL